ncbi:MAG: hypothetical protein ABI969_17830 [bacterium]
MTAPPSRSHPHTHRVNQDAARRARATPAAAPLLDASPDVGIRPIASLAEFRACVDLQAEVWGPEYSDSVRASRLQVATYVGGIVLGRRHHLPTM